MRPLRPFLLLVACGLTLLTLWPDTPALAQDDAAQGRAAFARGDYDQAYQLLYQAFLLDPGNQEINFFLGRAAFEAGRYEEAVMAFERVLISAPNANRVKLELARSYLRLGSREIAKQYFKEVLATNPPEQVWRNIQQFLTAIEAAEQRHFLNGLLTAEVNWDDNVNAAPNSNIVLLGSIPLTIDQQQQSDQVYATTLVVNHVYRFLDTPYAWKTSLLNYDAMHENQHVHDITYLGVSTGLLRQAERSLWEVNLQANHIDLGYDRYLGSGGIGVSYTRILAPELIVTASGLSQYKKYYQDAAKGDALNHLLRATLVCADGPDRISFSLGREWEAAAESYNSFHRTHIEARYDRQLPRQFALFASFHFQDSKYEQTHPLFGVVRSENQQDISLGISRRLWYDSQKKTSLTGQLKHAVTDANANVSLYEYDKEVTSLSLTLTF